MGLCYDSDHGNIGRDRMDGLDAHKERLIALHLNDNDGTSDQHRLIFSDTVDWERLAGIIARSAYGSKPMSMEVMIKNTGIETEEEFLKQAYETGAQYTHMVEEMRG